MSDFYYDRSPRFIPTIGLKPSVDKLPIHVRGRMIIGSTAMMWIVIGLGIWAHWA